MAPEAAAEHLVEADDRGQARDAFAGGDLQIAHVFVDGDEITGVIDWSEAGQGDALYDLASLTLGHQEHLGDVVAGCGTDLDLCEAARARSLRVPFCRIEMSRFDRR